MSESIRQSNLFSGEDYQKIFKAYSFIDYTAYDYDTLKQALLNYIQTYYPEDFNDYIESSEFIAIVELLAYYGTSLAFRTDLNSRENFIDTAERRESVIRLAQMVNYVPRRNIAANGLFKISAVQTNQQLVDANGINISNSLIFWNDPNNPDWFDQFVQICNAAFSSINPFGRPTKSGVIGSIPTDLYQLNNVLRLNVTYPLSISVSGQQYPVDICNPDFVTNQTIFERDPDPDNAFNFIYRNDSLGVSSPNTGFFLYFKQGNLLNIDTNFEFPVPNRLFPIDIQNINQTDVYVQETDENGTVVSKWVKVPALAGENIIYNSIQFAQRNIFDVISGANDTVTVRFADGNFGNIPTGLFRFWVRVSANQNLTIRPENAQGLQIAIPYIGSDNQEYTLRVIFNLEQTISNAAPAETNEQIKLRAPEVFSTQSRMVNGSDYNVLPLVFGNQIAKLQAIDRTYSGQSRYIDLNDPTGFHRDLVIFGQDGALFRDNQNVLEQVVVNTLTPTAAVQTLVINTIQETLRNAKVSNFFYDEYITQFESDIRVDQSISVPEGYSLLDIGNPNQINLYWKTSPARLRNITGYFATSTAVNSPAVTMTNSFTSTIIPGGTYQAWGFVQPGSLINFANATDPTAIQSVEVSNIFQLGLPTTINPLNPSANIGPVELSVNEQVNSKAVKVIPVFRNDLTGDLTSDEIGAIASAISVGVSFWLYYDLLRDTWGVSTTAITGVTNPIDLTFEYPPLDTVGMVDSIYSTWANYPSSGLIYVNIATNSELGTTTYEISARGRVFVFESYKDVRFYWEPNQAVIDSASGQALKDSIEIMPFVNTNQSVNNNEPDITNPATSFLKTPVSFNISGVFVQTDGYTDTSKVEVSLVDSNNDGVADNPSGFNEIVAPEDRVVFEYYRDELSGYQSTRPWKCGWQTELASETGDLYLYFPIDPSQPEYLSNSPYIANMELTDPNEINNPESVVSSPVFKYAYLGAGDLFFIQSLSQLEFDGINPAITIANQISAFMNITSGASPLLTDYPWLSGVENIINKSTIVETYFLNKIFLNATTAPGYGVYYNLQSEETLDFATYPTGEIVVSFVDTQHFDKNGKCFTQNLSVLEADRIPLYFKWSHYSPIDQRVDPAPSNIIDMLVITYPYYESMIIWKNSNGTLQNMPAAPTTEELRVQFQELDQYKMISDAIVWNSGQFKILFGPQAETELQATFKVVKSPSTSISDNEIKTRVIQAIDAYFDIRNWDFGEKFFYTELAAFIHQQLSRIISSVVIVPNSANSQFGNLFEIIAGPTQIFMSTATVNNVQIVANLTDQNLRV